MGFRSVWANDFNEDAARTYRANFGDVCMAGDIVSFLELHADEVPQADVVVGRWTLLEQTEDRAVVTRA